MNKLHGKVAVITGANSGIGLATAKQFAREGARVFLVGRRKAELDEAVAEIGHNARGVQIDVSNLNDLDRLYEIVKAEAGRIDVLFANAGVAENSALEEITENHFDHIFNINVKGTLFTVQKSLPLLSDDASIILTSSTVAHKGAPAFSVYAASKAAISSFARNWILELSSRKIRVNIISPGPIATPGARALSKTEEQFKAFQEYAKQVTPLGRIGDPDEVAAAAVFLASKESSFVTGSELFVDGGQGQI